MLRFFEDVDRHKILLDAPIVSDDIRNMQNLFDTYKVSWSVEFGHIYSVDRKLTLMLYTEVYNKKRDIQIITHKNRLSKYLHRLGFKSIFISLIKKETVDSEAIRIVLLGGSSDSSPKVINIVKNCSFNNLAFVIVQHVEPHKNGYFDEILQPKTAHKVDYAKDGEKIRTGKIYLAPSDEHLKIENGCFRFTNEKRYNYSRPSISLSYESFSHYYKDSLLAIQECGYAQDGVDKLELLKRNGSKIIIQDAKECEATSMVENAISLGAHNYVFNESTIIAYINFLDKKLNILEWIEYLLEMIYKRYSYDFRLYQRDMIKRRLEVFMIKHDIKSVKNAVCVIIFNKGAFKAFFLEVSINVTKFFRNPTSYRYMAEFMKKMHKHSRSLKIWSAGSSSGKEAYSIAILLSNLGMLDKSLIYATDFNGVIIEDAKNAIYSNESYEVAKENFSKVGLDDSLDNYVMKNDNFMMVNKRIMEKVLFLKHNLATDSSFNEFDIIICKNVIIYFNDNLQKKVFNLIYDSLRFGGHLVLGSSETIPISFTNKFEEFSNDCKIYKKVA